MQSENFTTKNNLPLHIKQRQSAHNSTLKQAFFFYKNVQKKHKLLNSNHLQTSSFCAHTQASSHDGRNNATTKRVLQNYFSVIIYLSPPSIFLITRAGLPAANTPSGMSCVTTDPAPMVEPQPILTPGKTVTLPPIHTLSPTCMGNAF